MGISSRQPLKSKDSFSTMWAKLNQSISGGDNDEGGDALLDDESDNLCSLSPTQVRFAETKFNPHIIYFFF